MSIVLIRVMVIYWKKSYYLHLYRTFIYLTGSSLTGSNTYPLNNWCWVHQQNALVNKLIRRAVSFPEGNLAYCPSPLDLIAIHNATIPLNMLQPWWRHQMETISALLARCDLINASDAEFWYFLWSAPEPTVEPTIETSMIWDAIAVIMTSLSCIKRSLPWASALMLFFDFWDINQWSTTTRISSSPTGKCCFICMQA